MGIYISSSGENRDVAQMATPHIQNAVNRIKRMQKEGTKLNSVDLDNLQVLEEEIAKRDAIS